MNCSVRTDAASGVPTPGAMVVHIGAMFDQRDYGVDVIAPCCSDERIAFSGRRQVRIGAMVEQHVEDADMSSARAG